MNLLRAEIEGAACAALFYSLSQGSLDRSFKQLVAWE
jgi:hypothetical protein